MAKKTTKLPVADMPVPVSISAKPTKEDKERERRYRAEDALRTCEQYEKNKQDRQLMSDVKTLAKEKMNDLKKVTKEY